MGLGLYTPSRLSAQLVPMDTLRYELDAVVVTGDRSERQLASSSATISILREADLAALPVDNLSDALRAVPGITFLNRDGSGNDPIATVRGFYGGGEAEYLLVLLDGKPINNVETGLVNWESIALADVASIEVLRGGSSSLYGDAAFGGVVNVITRTPSTANTRVSAQFGSFNTLKAQARTTGARYSAFADIDRTDGYREHGERRIFNAGGSVSLVNQSGRILNLSTHHNWTEAQDPGPLDGTSLANARTQSAAFYNFDQVDERRHGVTLEGQYALSERSRLVASTAGILRNSDLIRTLPLSPEFADTKNRDLQTFQWVTTGQWIHDGLLSPVPSKFMIGFDASVGRLESDYYTVLTGTAADYAAAGSFVRGDLDQSGESGRTALAAFVQYDLFPTGRLSFTLGGRFDQLNDRFESRSPSEGGETTSSHTAFSPKAGVNLQYAQSNQHSGHVYANVSRSFKAPTLDQLFDQRTIPVPFPPFSLQIANSELDPQRSTGFEVGLYHRASLGQAVAELSLAGYYMNVVDELDVDLQTFTYVNIGKSKHQGLESGLKFYLPNNVSVFANYAYQGVTFDFGDNDGNFLKAIPRDVVAGGLQWNDESGLGAGLFMSGARRMFVDDTNTIELPNYVTLDAKVSYRIGQLSVTGEVFNLFDKEYSTTAFPDPAGSDVVFFYPAAGRSARIGASVDF